jgi:hypothetical protein
MRDWLNVSFLGFCCGLAICVADSAAQAQTMTLVGSTSLALKSGESTEVGNVYYITNCKSLLKSTPEVEILEGPPGVSASIKEAMVLPRFQNCPAKVPGGTLVVSAKDIEDSSYSRLTLRIIYKTKDGDRKLSQVFNLSLIP